MQFCIEPGFGAIWPGVFGWRWNFFAARMFVVDQGSRAGFTHDVREAAIAPAHYRARRGLRDCARGRRCQLWRRPKRGSSRRSRRWHYLPQRPCHGTGDRIPRQQWRYLPQNLHRLHCLVGNRSSADRRHDWSAAGLIRAARSTDAVGPSCRNQIQRPSLARASIDAVKACGRDRLPSCSRANGELPCFVIRAARALSRLRSC